MLRERFGAMPVGMPAEQQRVAVSVEAENHGVFEGFGYSMEHEHQNAFEQVAVGAAVAD
jgi:hypothetical protein